MFTNIENNPFINKTLFTKRGTPLPISDDEELLYYSDGVYFYIQFGAGMLGELNKFVSYDGELFLTNFRLVYRPYCGNFDSFHTPLDNIIEIYKEKSIDILINNKSIVCVHLNFKNSYKFVFYNLLRKVKSESEDKNDKNKKIPYYSEFMG